MKIRDLIPFHKSKNVAIDKSRLSGCTSLCNTSSFDSIFQSFDELTNRFFSDFGVLARFESNPLTPRINVSETSNEIVIEAEIPGRNEKNINVSVEQGRLVLKGERGNEVSDVKDAFHRVECSYGYFERVIPLPEHAQFDQADAKYNKGILKITIPKDAKAENVKRIPVTTT